MPRPAVAGGVTPAWVLLGPVTIAMLLASCNQEPASFTLTLTPPVLDLRVTETAEVKVGVNRAGGFAEAVTITVAGDTDGLIIESLTIAQDTGTLVITATDDATIGTSTVQVEAVPVTAGGGMAPRSETLTLRIAKAIAGVTEVVVTGNDGSTQVRQGHGAVTLQVTGRNFERVTALSLGDLSLAVTSQTSDQLVLTTTVPHATQVGAKTLVLTSDGGDFELEAALTVTPVTAGPAGADATGKGTRDSPYRSMTHALSVAEAGDTVLLLDGVYSAASGETWPVLVGDDVVPGPNVPDGISLVGQSRAGAQIQGPGWPGDGAFTTGLSFAGTGAAATVTLSGFAAALYANGTAEVTLSQVRTSDNFVGLGAYQDSAVTLTDVALAHGNLGLIALEQAVVTITGGSVSDNEDVGLLISGGTPTLNATGFDWHDNRVGLSAGNSAAVTLASGAAHDNSQYGLEASQSATLALTGVDVYGNALGGIYFGAATLTMRDSEVRDNPEFGLYVHSQPLRIDLGTFSQPGGNALHDNAQVSGGPGGDQILDARPARGPLAINEKIAFTASATTLNGQAITADVYPGNGLWPYLGAPYFSILEQNNYIQFY